MQGSNNQNQNMQNIFATISAPCKTILCGEHAVVYGKSALAIALNLLCKIDIYKLPQSNGKKNCLIRLNFFPELWKEIYYRSQYYHIYVLLFSSNEKQSLEKYSQMIKKQFSQTSEMEVKIAFKISFLLQSHDKQLISEFLSGSSSYDIEVFSESPIGKGLGSSASFNSVLATGLLLIFNPSLFKKYSTKITIHSLQSNLQSYLYEISFKFEKVEHGNPSGIDNYVCLNGGVVKFNRKDKSPFQNLKSSALQGLSQLSIGLADSNVEKNTKKAVEMVRQLVEADNKYKEKIQSIGIISDEVIDILENFEKRSDWIELLFQKLKKNHILLAQLGLSNKQIEILIQRYSNNGESVGKITGSGMGGIILVVCRKQSKDKINSKKELISCEVDHNGLQITKYF